MLDRAQHRVLHFALLRAFLQRLAVLHADERAGYDDEAREQDPRAERGEQVVGARYLVQTQEHVDVARLR